VYVKSFAFAVMGFALVGCDAKSPAGASAGASEEQASSVSQTLDRLKELSTARQRGLTQSTPLLPFLVRTTASLRSSPNNAALLAAECVLGLNMAERATYIAQIESDGQKPQEVPLAGHEYSLIVHGSQDELNASCLAAILAWSAQPVLGWTSHGFANEANAGFARTLYTMGRASALIARPVLETLATKVGYTEEQLAVMARDELVKNATSVRALVVAEMARTQALPLSSFVLDFAGASAAPVHFIIPSEFADVSADGFGVKVIRDGVELYGAGFVQGTRYSVETLSSAVAATRTTSTATQSTDSRTAQSAKAEVTTQ
jgi:hypothetical protein